MLPKLNSREPYRTVTTLWCDQSEFGGFQYERWNGAETDSEDTTRPVLITYVIKAAGWNMKIIGLLDQQDYVDRACSDKNEFRRSTHLTTGPYDTPFHADSWCIWQCRYFSDVAPRHRNPSQQINALPVSFISVWCSCRYASVLFSLPAFSVH